MKIEDIQFEKVDLPNGAVLNRISGECEVCVGRGEHPSPARFQLTYQGQTIDVCDAHTQLVLDLSADQAEKGEGIFGEMFGMSVETEES